MWQIEQLTFCHGWVNVSHDGVGNPLVFNTKEEAHEELEAHIETMKEAKALGHLADVTPRREFRIRKVHDGRATHSQAV